jgi:hypothetical protein
VDVVADVYAVVNAVGWDRFVVWGGSGGAPHALAGRAMQEVAGAWQRAGAIAKNLIWMAGSEVRSIERPATDLVTQLHM